MLLVGSWVLIGFYLFGVVVEVVVWLVVWCVSIVL